MRDHAAWFRRLVWLGILINLSFAIPAIADPTVLVRLLGVDTPAFSEEHIWLRNTGFLLIALAIFYAAAARSPLETRPFAFRVVLARLLAAIFWLWMVLVLDVSPVFWYFAATDGLLAILQGYFLMRAVAAHPPEPSHKPWRRGILSRIYGAFFRGVNKCLPWHVLDSVTLWLSRGYLGTLNLGGMRTDLRERNLYDTPEPEHIVREWDPSYRDTRSPDGSFNSLIEPSMGAVGDTFGRNVPLHEIHVLSKDDLVGNPSPREVSRHILARQKFQPAEILNLLAAAWIQFQNHGWFNHYLRERPSVEDSNAPENFVDIPLAEDDDWDPDGNGNPDRVMRLRRTLAIQSGTGRKPPTFASVESQWWDGSQLYGSSQDRQKELRSGIGGRLKVADDGLLPEDPNRLGTDLTGFNQNWWLGLSLLHNLFAKEHNTICEALVERYGERDDEWLFQKARLVNAALMAKIHTLDWTKNILRHKSLQISMNANWWGVQGEAITKAVGRLTGFESISGIPGSPTEYHSAPHSLLTEEFVAVYRMHPLIPDEVTFRSMSDPYFKISKSFSVLQGKNTRSGSQGLSLSVEDQFYSFGREYSGAVTLGNYPQSLINFEKDNGDKIDLGALDIFRDRERGIPRYNRFRELLRMPKVESFEEMTGLGSDHPTVQKLKELYKDGVDSVDLMVGMYAEKPPRGFGFSDTAFRIFILMASRRIKSDRFFTVDFTPKVYTELGIKWVQNNDMLTVLRRHYPGLEPALRGLDNAFAPWNDIHSP